MYRVWGGSLNGTKCHKYINVTTFPSNIIYFQYRKCKFLENFKMKVRPILSQDMPKNVFFAQNAQIW